MILAALLDAGADRARLEQAAELLRIGPVEIEVERVEREGVGALHVRVVEPADPPPRTWRAMREIIGGADLPDRAHRRALDAFDRLAGAEAAVHGMPVEDVHFHEIGGVDTLVDICGAAMLLEDLGIERIASSALPFTRGLIRSEHGVLPAPAPAALEVLRAAGARIEGIEGGRERVTPTGAALVAALAGSYGPPPPLVLELVGYGAGSDETPGRPNVLRVLVGESDSAPRAGEVVLVETSLDDLLPELIPDAAERCYAAGALDVWTVPAQMKKGRPGIVLSALARPEREAAVAAAILEETSALGVRVSRLRRYELEREERTVDVDGGAVRVKLGLLDGRVVNVAPEHDDCADLARRTGRPVKAVWAAAVAAAHAYVEPR